MLNRIDLHQQTFNDLYEAYHSERLFPGTCESCVVTFICRRAAKMIGISPCAWASLFFTGENGNQQTAFMKGTTKLKFMNQPQWRRSDALVLIGYTGYTVRELARIEHAYETAAFGKDYDEHSFNCLIAALHVLDQIHGYAKDDLEKENRKRLFKLRQLL